MAIAGFLLLDAVVLGANVYLLRERNATTVVDLDDALAQFRTDTTTSFSSGPPSTTLVVEDPAASTDTTVAAGAPAGATVDPGPATTTPTTAPVTSTRVPAATPALTLPSEGVYAYATEGGERISTLNSSHTYPATTYAVVRHLGGCGWEISSEVVREHRDRRELCNEPNRIVQPLQQRVVEFLGTRVGDPYRCTPPLVLFEVGAAPGTSTSAVCDDGAGSTAALTATFVGAGQERVGGDLVDVVTIRLDSTVTGAAKGTTFDEFTLVAATGLPVRVVRSVDTVSNALGGQVRYRESASFELLSLTPTT